MDNRSTERPPSPHPTSTQGINRREFLRSGVAAAALLGSPTSLLALTGCDNGARVLGADPSRFAEAYREAVRIAGRAGLPPPHPPGGGCGGGRCRRTVFRTFLYNGQMPGPEIRVGEGERLRVTLENRLPGGDDDPLARRAAPLRHGWRAARHAGAGAAGRQLCLRLRGGAFR